MAWLAKRHPVSFHIPKQRFIAAVRDDVINFGGRRSLFIIFAVNAQRIAPKIQQPHFAPAVAVYARSFGAFVFALIIGLVV